MSEDFKKIEMYQCTWCGKIFYTDQRHHCKFRPSYRNCFSCTHCQGILIEEAQEGGYTDKVVDCSEGIHTSILTIAQKQWNLSCPKWQIMEDYEGRKTYARRIIRIKHRITETENDSEDDSLPF